MSAVARKASIGVAWFQLALALMLFVPAGSIRFWQGWTYWIISFAAVLIITIYFLKHDPGLIERRLRAGPAAEPETSQKIIQAITGMLFCPLPIVPGLDYRF